MEYPEWEGTQKDHPAQLLALPRTPLVTRAEIRAALPQEPTDRVGYSSVTTPNLSKVTVPKQSSPMNVFPLT